jgi:hypothetical protein
VSSVPLCGYGKKGQVLRKFSKHPPPKIARIVPKPHQNPKKLRELKKNIKKSVKLVLAKAGISVISD